MTHRRVAILDDRTCDRCRLLDGVAVDPASVQAVGLIPPSQCEYERISVTENPLDPEDGCRCVLVAVPLRGWARFWAWVRS